MTDNTSIPTHTSDTIVAISTPPGIGGIAVARLSGPRAIEIADRLWHGKSLSKAGSHTAHFGEIASPSGETLDQAVATVFRAPRSFTGENVVEFSIHGSRYVQRQLLTLLIEAGARIAEAGEFTRRAFMAGKIDLSEAEAVADVIAADSRAAHRIAISQLKGGFSRRIHDLRRQLIDLASLLELELDFSEEDVEFASRTRLHQLATSLRDEISRLHSSYAAGNAIRQGIPVAIIGPTNAGKSSLLNSLLGDERAIVSDIHGTTRDTVEELLSLGDFTFRFIDTAGLRHTSDIIERIGIDRTLSALQKARIIIVMADVTLPFDPQTLHTVTSHAPADTHLIIVLNKTDRATPEAIRQTIADITDRHLAGEPSGRPAIIPLSTHSGEGIETLRQAIIRSAEADRGQSDEDILVSNARHARALSEALQSIQRFLQSMDAGLSGDLLAQDLRETLHHLSTITGQITTTDLLTTIFSRFCIGK